MRRKRPESERPRVRQSKATPGTESGIDTLEARYFLSVTVPDTAYGGRFYTTHNAPDAFHLANSSTVAPRASTSAQWASVSTSEPVTLTRPGGRSKYLSSISVGPLNLALADHTSYRFKATAYDQWGIPLVTQPAFNWSVQSGGAGGTIAADGTYTAPFSQTGAEIIRATVSGISGTVSFKVTPAGIFTADNDIGQPGIAGHYSYDSGTYTVVGGGADIWGTADQFNFASVPLNGDGVIVARVKSLQNSDTWAKAGVMFRETTDTGSRDVYLAITPHAEVQFIDRTSPGASALVVSNAVGVGTPVWLKLVRKGNSITAFWSSNGTAWNPVGGAVDVSMMATVYAGLGVVAHNNALSSTGTFDNVSVTSQPTSGVYRLTTRGQQGMALDIEGWANANGSPVSLYTANHTSNQQWLVQGQGDGTYKIYAYSGQNSLQMLDDNNGATTNGSTVTTYEDNNSSAQRWIFVPDTSGYWRIVPANAAGTLQTLEIKGGNFAGLGSRADIYQYVGGANQVFHLDYPGTPAVLPSYKKGLAGYPQQIGNVHPSWIYTWGGDEPANLPASVEFVPMAWSYYGNTNNNFSNWLNGYVKKQPGVKSVLGFNEPDSTTQANLTVAQALDGWQYLQSTGLPLGSPAAVHADDQWMRDFMAGAAAKNYRVDYVTIHWYGGNDPNGFINYVDYIHNLYNKPVWVTEFAPADWSGQHGISARQAYDFMRQVLPALNSRSYVQRYAWFSADVNDAALGQAALYNHDGSLTPLGQLYSRS